MKSCVASKLNNGSLSSAKPLKTDMVLLRQNPVKRSLGITHILSVIGLLQDSSSLELSINPLIW
jgi:hypothetical protein